MSRTTYGADVSELSVILFEGLAVSPFPTIEFQAVEPPLASGGPTGSLGDGIEFLA